MARASLAIGKEATSRAKMGAGPAIYNAMKRRTRPIGTPSHGAVSGGSSPRPESRRVFYCTRSACRRASAR